MVNFMKEDEMIPDVYILNNMRNVQKTVFILLRDVNNLYKFPI